MDSKKVILVGMTVGSVLGSFIPTLWGEGEFSMWSIILSAVGGILGIWIGYKLSR